MKIVIFVQKKIKPNTKQKMKDFLKYMLAAIVGVCIVGVVFTIIGIMSIAGMVASSSGSETKVSDNSVFILNLSGSVEERAQPNPLSQLMGDNFETYGLNDILSSIKKAKENEKIKKRYGTLWRILKKAGNSSLPTEETIFKARITWQV